MLWSVYVRFESATENSRGVATGVFAMANGLARSGALSDEDYRWWRTNNDWMNAGYSNPADANSTLFDRAIHPRTECWFKSSAEHLLARTRGYLSLLERYGLAWVERRTSNPGTILYEDDDQVVVEI